MADAQPIIAGCFPIDRTNYKDKYCVKLYNSGLLYYPAVSNFSSKNKLTARLPKISKAPWKSRKNKSSNSQSSGTPNDIDSTITDSNEASAQAAPHTDNEHKRKEQHQWQQNQELQYDSARSSIASGGNASSKPEMEPAVGLDGEIASNGEAAKHKTSTKPHRPTDLPVKTTDNHNTNQHNTVLNGASGSREHSRNSSNVSADIHTPSTSGSPVDGKDFSPQFKFLPILSILGCDCQRGESLEDVATYFVVYAYPRSRPSKDPKSSECENLSPGEKGKLPACRRQEIVTVKFDTLTTFEENYKEAARWMVAVRTLLRGYTNIGATVTDGDILRMPAAQKLLIMVNPFSGPGQALTIFQERVVPLLAQAQIDYKLVVTERAGHAEEFVYDMELSAWNGIVIVSGDGLLFEVVNGLMKRSDWKSAIKIPLGVIPGGSGNALACSICNYAGEPYMDKHVLHSSFIIAKQRDVVAMDLVAVDTCNGKRLYSFLSVGWGMMADVDIGSERYRNLGNSRFALVAVFKIFSMKKYRGRISFLPVDDYVIPTNGKLGTFHIQKGSGKNQEEAEITGGRDELSPYLPPLDQPVPEGWVINEDDFILLAGVYQSHLAKDNLMTPQATLDDGFIHLVFVRGICTRMQMMSLFLALENGVDPNSHVDYAEVIKVKAFRLEPLTPRGMMTVDGEMIDYGPIQAQILPGLARVMSLTKTSANEFD